MSSIAAAQMAPHRGQLFQHEALLYDEQDHFLEGTSSFIGEALDADEPVLVVVGEAKISLLREHLGGDADRVLFADMAAVGSNPARIIPAWREFVDRHTAPDRCVWGIGEPVWPGRTPAELAECQRHEALLNLAFADSPEFRLLCPYDTGHLDPAVVSHAHCTHPLITGGGVRGESGRYAGLETIAAPFDEPLPEPPVKPRELPYRAETLRLVRRFVAAHAADAGLAGDRVDDLVLAIDELASNSVRHGGGGGVLRVWEQDGTLLCEVRDGGLIADPMAGRVHPTGERVGGYGLWMVNHLCDLVQVRSSPGGTVIRVHTRIP